MLILIMIKNIFILMALFIFVFITPMAQNIHAQPGDVCCKFYRQDNGMDCGGWHLEVGSDCNTTNGKDFCGNANGRAMSNPLPSAFCPF